MTAPSSDPRCRAARAWVSAAIDGEAGPSEAAALRAHLAECPDCRSFAALAESLALRVRTAEPVAYEVPWLEPAEPVRVLAPVPSLAARRRRRLRPREHARAAFAAVVVAAAAFGVFLSGSLQQDGPGRTGELSGQLLTVADTSADYVDGRPVGPNLSQRDRPVVVQGLPVNRDRRLPDDPLPTVPSPGS